MQQQTSPAKVWFITGAARGIGLSLARQLLARGDAVAATSRTLTSLRQATIPRDCWRWRWTW